MRLVISGLNGLRALESFINIPRIYGKLSRQSALMLQTRIYGWNVHILCTEIVLAV